MRLLALLPLFIAFGVLAQAGTLDPTFGTDGIVTTGFGTADVSVRDVAVQQDGKIVVLCLMYDDPSYIQLVRYSVDGAIDTSFGSGGIVVHPLGYDYLGVGSLCILPNGKIMLTAYVLGHILVLRYLPDGTLDSGLTLNPGESAYTNAIIAQPDGKVLVVGSVREASTWKIGVIRLLPNMTYDATFDGDGLVTTDIEGSTNETAYGATLQPDGSIVVCGSITTGLCVLRYLPDGTLDQSFNGDGIFTYATAVESDALQATVLQPDGKVLAVGTSTTPASMFRLLRLNADGTLDASFAEGGIANATPGQSSRGVDLALQPDGGIIVGGGLRVSTFVNAFVVMRFDPQGVPDPAFDGDGVVVTEITSEGITCPAVALDAQWNILLAGTAQYSQQSALTMVRYLNEMTNGLGEETPLQSTLAPNPATDHTEIMMNAPSNGPLHVLLRDTEGRLVRDIPQAQCTEGTRVPLDLSGLSPGFYSLELRTDKRVSCSRLIKL